MKQTRTESVYCPSKRHFPRKCLPSINCSSICKNYRQNCSPDPEEYNEPCDSYELKKEGKQNKGGNKMKQTRTEEESTRIDFFGNKEAFILQSEIGKRASELADRLGFKYKQMTAMMDIGACHNNGNPLRLADLLESDEANFSHDVFGIRANIDRTTGKLLNCFVPRYSEIEQ